MVVKGYFNTWALFSHRDDWIEFHNLMFVWLGRKNSAFSVKVKSFESDEQVNETNEEKMRDDKKTKMEERS